MKKTIFFKTVFLVKLLHLSIVYYLKFVLYICLDLGYDFGYDDRSRQRIERVLPKTEWTRVDAACRFKQTNENNTARIGFVQDRGAAPLFFIPVTGVNTAVTQ